MDVKYKSIAGGVLLLLSTMVIGLMAVLGVLTGFAALALFVGAPEGIGASFAPAMAVVGVELVGGIAALVGCTGAVVSAVAAFRGGRATVIHRGGIFLAGAAAALVASVWLGAGTGGLITYLFPSDFGGDETWSVFRTSASPAQQAMQLVSEVVLSRSFTLYALLLAAPLAFAAGGTLGGAAVRALDEMEAPSVDAIAIPVPTVSRWIGAIGMLMAATTGLSALAAGAAGVRGGMTVMIAVVFVLILAVLNGVFSGQLARGSAAPPWRVAVLSVGASLSAPALGIACALMTRGAGEVVALPLILLGPLHLALCIAASACWPPNRAYSRVTSWELDDLAS